MTALNRETLLNKLLASLTLKDRSAIGNASLDRETVYTSFDGDFMHFLNEMQKYVLSNGYIPINPEAALGYYVSTETLGGKKVLVMMDCLKTELFCDKMWIFLDSSHHITEGVFAEAVIWSWMKESSLSTVDFFPDNWIEKKPDYHAAPQPCTVDIISPSDPQYAEEIKNRLLDPFKKSHLQTAYIIANVKNLKHIDWARRYCYMNNMTPICSQTLLPGSLYYASDDMLMNKQYVLDRLTLLKKSETALLFIDTRHMQREINNLDYCSCCELYYLLYHNRPFTVIDWGDAGVPKYNRSGGQWALTSEEAEEVS